MTPKFWFGAFICILLLAQVFGEQNFAQDDSEESYPPSFQQNDEVTEDLYEGDEVTDSEGRARCHLPRSLLPAVDAVEHSLQVGANGTTPAVIRAIRHRDHARKVYKHALHRYQKAKKSFKEAKALSQLVSTKCLTSEGSSAKELALLRVLKAKVTDLVNSGSQQTTDETSFLQAVISETSSEELRQNIQSAMSGTHPPQKLLDSIHAMIEKILAHHKSCTSNVRAHSSAYNKLRRVLHHAHKVLREAAARERTASRRVNAARTAAMRHACAAAFVPAIKHIRSLRHSIKEFSRGNHSQAHCPVCNNSSTSSSSTQTPATTEDVDQIDGSDGGTGVEREEEEEEQGDRNDDHEELVEEDENNNNANDEDISLSDFENNEDSEMDIDAEVDDDVENDLDEEDEDDQ